MSNTHPKGSVVPTFIKQKKLNGNNCGIIAHDFYSLAYSNHELYVWGYNGGQFGVHWSVQTDCEEISVYIHVIDYWKDYLIILYTYLVTNNDSGA